METPAGFMWISGGVFQEHYSRGAVEVSKIFGIFGLRGLVEADSIVVVIR